MSDPIRISQPDIDDPYYRPVESLDSDDESGSGKSSVTTVTDGHGIFDLSENGSLSRSSSERSSDSLSRSLSESSPESLSPSPFSSHSSSPRVPIVQRVPIVPILISRGTRPTDDDIPNIIGTKRIFSFYPSTNVPISRQKLNHYSNRFNGGKRKTRKGKNKSAKRKTRKGKNKSAKRKTRKGKNKSAKRKTRKGKNKTTKRNTKR
jgi:hypothetical protein